MQVNKTNNQFISDHTIFHKSEFNSEVYEKRKNFLTSTGYLNFLNILLMPGL